MICINDIPQEKQFQCLLNERQAKSIEQQIIDIDFTEDNLEKLKELFKLWHQKTGVK